MLYHELLVILIVTFAHVLADTVRPKVSRPPTIIPSQRLKDVIYFEPEGKQSKDLPCVALGSDPKTFSWLKNGKPFDSDAPKYMNNVTKKSRIVFVDSNTGSLKLTDMVDHDEGIYQCIANNKYGRSYSKKVRLLKATKRSFESKEVHSRRVQPAHPLKLECNPPHNDPPGVVRWLQYYDEGKGKQTVRFNDRIAMDKHGNLYFANVQEVDENEGEKYACSIEYTEFSIYVEGAFTFIEVQEGEAQAQFPPDLVYSSDQYVMGLKGESVTMQCIFSGNPTPTVTWERSGKVLKSSKRIKLQYHKLVIKDLQYADAGDYKCKGINSVLKNPKEKSFKLDVQAKPEWVSEPMKVDAGVEETATFECVADGRPKPKIDWFINGEPVENLPEDNRRSHEDTQLRFTKLRQDDAKVVQCNASNIHGSLWADVGLSVLAYKPEILASFESIKVTEGHEVTLPCEVDGKPTPKTYWKRDGQIMSGRGYVMDPAGNLTIVKTTTDDAGIWTCFSNNIYGKANSTGELKVRAKTVIDNPPLPEEQQKRHGQPIQYKCGATTDHREKKNLKISWLKDGKPVDYSPSNIWKTSNNALMIKAASAEDTGTYTCVATNGLDTDKVSVTLKILAPPDPPKDVKVESCLSRSALVSWTPGDDNFRPITNYYVEYNHSYAPDVWVKAANVTNPSITQATVKLSPHANYTFRVMAENVLGRSQPSMKTSTACESNAEYPDKHPSNLRDDTSRPGWLIIKWDPMPEIEHNGEGFQYQLNIRKDGTINSTLIYDWRETVREINIGLIYEPYEIFVEALNEIGKCPGTTPVLIAHTGEAEPLTAPSNFELVPNKEVQAKQAEFQWDPVDPSAKAMQGEFKGYKIRYWKVGQENTTLKEVKILRKAPLDSRIRRAVPAKEHAILKNLPPYSDLKAYVVATNTYFESNSSNELAFTTPEGVPGKPSYARVLRRGHDHFLIEWGQPTEHNGIIIGYEIGYQEIDGFNVGDTTIFEEFNDTSVDRAVIDGLNTSSMYTILVWAKTKKGSGEPYYFDAKTTVEGPLLNPIMDFGLIGEEFVNITWSFSSKSDSPSGSSYFVMYKAKDSNNGWKKVTAEDTHHWVNISDLEPRTKYEVKVIASNGFLESASETRIVMTRGELPSVSEETSIAQAPWFIVMMIAIAILILFIVIVCFVKRSRGEKYNVQEREKLRGTDVENTEKDLLNPYPKSGETDLLAAGSPDSFDNEEHKLPGGSETDSMAEYGDVDPSKFNEDGSFIGQYGNQKTDDKGNQQSAMSTFV